MSDPTVSPTTTMHTPGPWRVVVGDNYSIEADAYPVSFPHIFPGDDTGDAVAYVGNRPNDFGRANARLIAAAPDLLAALEGVLRVADRATDEFDAARAAIAKAKLGDRT